MADEEDLQEQEETEAAPETPEPGGEPEEEEQETRPPPAREEISADSDPLEEEQGESSRGILSRLNPKRLFSKHTPEYFIKEGRELLEGQSYAQAMVAFKKALELDSNNVPAFRGLGKVFFKKGGRSNMQTALKYYLEAVKRHPMDHDLYAITAKIYDAMGQRKEATLERKKFVIVRALEADPKNPIANNNMGILFLQQGKPDMALDYFNKAVNSDKNYDVAYRNLAAVYLQMARETSDEEKKINLNMKAKEEIQKAVEISPTSQSLMALARIQLKEGNFEEALSLGDRVDEMEPANPEVFKLKKLALEGLGRFEEARDAHESMMVFSNSQGDMPEEEAAEE